MSKERKTDKETLVLGPFWNMSGVSHIAEASAVSFMDFAVVWTANWVNKGFSREKIATSSTLRKPHNCKQNTTKQINNVQIGISEETVWLFLRMEYVKLLLFLFLLFKMFIFSF